MILRAVVLLLLATLAGAVDLVGVQWGVDGRVLADRPNQLAVLLRNPGAATVEGVVELSAGQFGNRQGVSWTAPLYLAPGTQRWLRFAPWVDADARSFTVTVQPTGRSFTLDQPDLGRPAAVLLRDAARVTALASPLPRLADDLFPTSVGLTDGLAALVIDHVPDWQEPQRRAFLDWLNAGGRVFVVHGADGQPPRFAGDLAALDRPGVVGAGRVRHLPRGAGGLDQDDLGLPARGDGDEQAARASQQVWPLLRALVRPDHAWALIILALVAYILVIGPGALIAGKLGLDWRWLNLGLVAVITGTALLLALVGRRGYGERTGVQSVSVARALGGGAWDVATWGQLFVTSSDRWTISHPGDGRAYACPGGDERIDGTAVVGPEAALITGIPLYSGRTFTLRARMAGPDLAAQVLPSADDHLAIQLSAGAVVRKALAVRGDRIYELNASRLAEDGSRLERSATHALDGWLKDARQERLDEDAARAAGDAALDAAFAPLVAWSLHDAARSGQVALFVLADQPAGFRARVAGDTAEQGRVIYRLDLPAPAPTAQERP